MSESNGIQRLKAKTSELVDRLKEQASQRKATTTAVCLALVLVVGGLAFWFSSYGAGHIASAAGNAVAGASGSEESDAAATTGAVGSVSSLGIGAGDGFVDQATNGQNSSYLNDLIKLQLKAVNTGGISIAGATVDENKLRPLLDAIAAVEGQGYSVGFTLVDVTNGISISYNADSAFYSASSIKGPYVAALGKYELGEDVTRESSRIASTLEWSDNEAYAGLRASYGNGCMEQLVAESGAEELSSTGVNDEVESARQVQSADSLSDNNYEFVTPNQLAALWGVVDGYLGSDEPGAEFLASEFAQPETSGLKYVGRAYGTTWSKAGWFYDDSGDAYQTTVDAGVVREQTGDVVVAVMLNKSADFAALDSIALPLLQLHTELLG